MSLASGVNNPAIDNLVKSSLESENERLRLGWISYEKFTDIKPAQIGNIYHAHTQSCEMLLLLLGSSGECTQTLVSEFARIYSLPTHKYRKVVSQFRRYSTWLYYRNHLIKGFT